MLVPRRVATLACDTWIFLAKGTRIQDVNLGHLIFGGIDMIKDSFMYFLCTLPSLKRTCSPLKMDGWNTILSYYWVSAYFQGRTCC